MNDEMYGVMVESDIGIDVFGNPKGKPMVFECCGDMSKSQAIDKASSLQISGRYGKVKIVRFEVLNCIIV